MRASSFKLAGAGAGVEVEAEVEWVAVGAVMVEAVEASWN